ncbi:hypothetical protein [Mucilaginibacter myungsuensis]|uniref:Uncharacterized protein n=1 Tax=Mucilaginibacter myungsuensis TaxID=649104 RepID=A0A929L0X0_9SPHI|nr:hypothetical protein [Mucilaginibacter myungsuensis]MBE9664202.1 hypothetical protein [Mucilaginibacter myungsuensis]MDN3599904.1 hypothetical protein [Mucilaginibacter myungsuensis]
METLKLNRDLITIWSLALVSIGAVVTTRHVILMLPLLVYMLYKSTRGIITYRGTFLMVPFCIMLMSAFAGIYLVVLRSIS